MKKLISFLATLLIFTQTLTALAFYSDVPNDHEYYTSINALYKRGLLPEYEDNLFQPDKNLTLVDFYELLLTFGKASLSTEIDLPYTNTDDNASYAPYLQTAIDLEILRPIGANPEFSFKKTIGKNFVLSTMFKTLGIGTSYFFDKNLFPFADVKPTSDTAVTAYKAAELGILEEDPQTYKTAKRVTKAEAIDYLYKIYQYEPSSQVIIEVIDSKSPYNPIEETLIENDKFDIFLDVWSTLQTDYFYKYDLDEEAMIQSAIKGLTLQIEDIYTIYHSAKDAEDFFQSITTTEYQGVGMSIELIDGNATVVSPFKDSPAEEAGLKPHDIIVQVDGEDITGLSIESVANKIKGPADTYVKIKIIRDGKELDFSIKRAFVLYKSVQHELIEKDHKKIGYIEIITFGDIVYEEFVQAAEELLEQNPAGFIIDLRNNPGGYMDAAIDIIGLFTDEIKTALKLVFVDSKSTTYKTDGNGLLDGQKVVVLINKGSASASEIVAGALKDHNLATIVGTKSFGKGTVQELTQYSDGSLFKYTVSKWLTPGGVNIDQTGLTPHRLVENTDNNDKQLETALEEF